MVDTWIWLWLAVLIAITVIELLGESRSQLADRLMRWPANLGLFGLELATTAGLSAGLVMVASAVPGDRFLAAIPFWLQAPLVLILFSFITYWLHRFSHSQPGLWRFHRVHHSDTIVDPTTSFRHHPGEVAFAFLALQVPILLLHPSPQAVAIVAIMERCFAAATHTSLTLPPRVDHLLGLVFVTPQQHAIHHSDFQPETDSNFGTVLNIWDRLFGTYCAKPLRNAAQFRLGLTEIPAAKAEDLAVLLILPLRARDPWPK